MVAGSGHLDAVDAVLLGHHRDGRRVVSGSGFDVALRLPVLLLPVVVVVLL